MIRRNGLPHISLHLMTVMILMTIMFVATVSGEKVGEVIPLLSRVQYNNQRTAWTHLEMKLNPRFGMRKIVDINGVISLLKKYSPQPLEEHEDIATRLVSSASSEENTVKISFALEEADFVTPWITVMKNSEESKSHFLTKVDFMFQYAGSRILQVKYKEHYSNEEDLGMSDADTLEQNLARIPEHIKLTYHWDEVIERDTTAGITFLYFISFAIGLAVLIIILVEFM